LALFEHDQVHLLALPLNLVHFLLVHLVGGPEQGALADQRLDLGVDLAKLVGLLFGQFLNFGGKFLIKITEKTHIFIDFKHFRRFIDF
jgi:hypothetical protein